MPAAIAGIYGSRRLRRDLADQRSGEDMRRQCRRRWSSGGAAWTLAGIDADTVEIVSPAGWITATQVAHLVRDNAGRIVALEVSTGRIKKLRFERQPYLPSSRA